MRGGSASVPDNISALPFSPLRSGSFAHFSLRKLYKLPTEGQFMGKRGSAYYLFILLFIVAFVTVVGVLYNPTVTGNVVLDPNTIPPVQNAYTIQHELAQQIVPSVNRRVFVVPHSGNEAAAQALVTPRPFFPNGVSADVS